MSFFFFFLAVVFSLLGSIASFEPARELFVEDIPSVVSPNIVTFFSLLFSSTEGKQASSSSTSLPSSLGADFDLTGLIIHLYIPKLILSLFASSSSSTAPPASSVLPTVGVAVVS